MVDRRLVVGVGALAVVATTVGTAAFGVDAVDREFRVAVADGDEAYLGVETTDQVLTAGSPETVTLAALENRVDSGDLTVDVTVSDGAPGSPVLDGHDATVLVAPGGTTHVSATVDCDELATNPTTETWTVRLVAAGEGVTVELSRSVSVTCENGTTGQTTATATPTATAAQTTTATATGSQ